MYEPPGLLAPPEDRARVQLTDSRAGLPNLQAGIPHRRIYDLRHTYATWALAAGVSVFTLSRRMGTSLAMIDATYGHLAADAEEQERALLDAYDAAQQSEKAAVGAWIGHPAPGAGT